MSKTHLIWDGQDYREVTAEQAEELVANDQAQDLTLKMLSAMELKRRSEFAGYKKGYVTRELRASQNEEHLTPPNEAKLTSVKKQPAAKKKPAATKDPKNSKG